MNYATIKSTDIANGQGIRVSLFVSGCTHQCKGCFNQEAWDFNYGERFDENCINKILKDLNNPYISGLSILGGEPLEHQNQKGLLPLVKKVKETYPEKDIWCYTGYTFDNDIVGNMCKKWEETPELLSHIDVIVDGKFEEEKKDLNLRFRGSANQRVIDVQESLKQKQVIPLSIG